MEGAGRTSGPFWFLEQPRDLGEVRQVVRFIGEQPCQFFPVVAPIIHRCFHSVALGAAANTR